MGDLFGFFARQAIDNARIARVFFFQKLEKLRFGIVFERDSVANVRTVEAGDKVAAVL